MTNDKRSKRGLGGRGAGPSGAQGKARRGRPPAQGKREPAKKETGHAPFAKPKRAKAAPGKPNKDRTRGVGKRGATAQPASDTSAAGGPAGERVAKVIARAGLCSRRTAEGWVIAGRVAVNGTTLTTPAVTVTPADTVTVDGTRLPDRERTRLWLYHKPRGLVTTNSDPEGRATVFDRLPPSLPRVLTIGRLDINTEGLLLLTNDGGLSRVLELPATGWLRRYRVRAFGKITQDRLDALADGIAIDGILYGAIEAAIDKEQGDNTWLTIALREGKNREIKRVLEHLGLSVNRLIRVSFGPFQLADLAVGEVREIRGRVLRDQLGDRLADEAGVDFDAPLHTPSEDIAAKPVGERPKKRSGSGGASGYVSAREARAMMPNRRTTTSAKDDKAGKSRRHARNTRDTDDDAVQYVSPRSRFRFPTPPKARPADDPMKRTGPMRRVWDEDGSLIEEHAPAPDIASADHTDKRPGGRSNDKRGGAPGARGTGAFGSPSGRDRKPRRGNTPGGKRGKR